jgi:hypothetical protein
MVYNLVILIIIPVILAIVTVSPFGEEKEPVEVISPTEQPNFLILYFTLLAIWLLILARTLYLRRKRIYQTR